MTGVALGFFKMRAAYAHLTKKKKKKKRKSSKNLRQCILQI